MDKLQKKIRDVQEEHAEEILSAHLDKHEQKKRDKALMMVGAFTVTNRIAQALSAELMRALIQFQEEKIYESFGYETFVDFLNDSEHSPMTKSQFYERKKVLEIEGDAAFDLLNSLSLPIQKRKLLGAGNVQVDGSTVFITTQNPDGDDQIVEIELNDRTRLLQTLSALADQNTLLNAKSAKQKEKIEKGESEIENLQKKLDAGGSGKGSNSSIEFESFMRIVNSTDALAATIEKEFTIIEREAHSEVYLDAIFASFLRLRAAYGRTDLVYSTQSAANPERKPLAEMSQNEFQNHVAKKMKGYKGEPDDAVDNEFSSITSNLNDEELEELMD